VSGEQVLEEVACGSVEHERSDNADLFAVVALAPQFMTAGDGISVRHDGEVSVRFGGRSRHDDHCVMTTGGRR
jgi:hypothetical protein